MFVFCLWFYFGIVGFVVVSIRGIVLVSRLTSVYTFDGTAKEFVVSKNMVYYIGDFILLIDV